MWIPLPRDEESYANLNCFWHVLVKTYYVVLAYKHIRRLISKCIKDFFFITSQVTSYKTMQSHLWDYNKECLRIWEFFWPIYL